MVAPRLTCYNFSGGVSSFANSPTSVIPCEKISCQATYLLAWADATTNFLRLISERRRPMTSRIFSLSLVLLLTAMVACGGTEGSGDQQGATDDLGSNLLQLCNKSVIKLQKQVDDLEKKLMTADSVTSEAVRKALSPHDTRTYLCVSGDGTEHRGVFAQEAEYTREGVLVMGFTYTGDMRASLYCPARPLSSLVGTGSSFICPQEGNRPSTCTVQ